MELRILNHTANELEVEILHENETVLNPIKEVLLADEEVEFAEYIIEHPSLSIPRIYLRTVGKAKPAAALSRAIKELVGQFDEFEDRFVQQLKQR